MKFVAIKSEIFFGVAEPSLMQLRELEFLLSSAYRGYGSVVLANRKDYVTPISQTSEEMEDSNGILPFKILGKYIQELGGLYLPILDVEKVLGSKEFGSPLGKIPRKMSVETQGSSPFEAMKPFVSERKSVDRLNHDISTIGTMQNTGRHLCTCTIQVPVTISLLFMNLGIIKHLEVCLPNYLNQPDVNNRRVEKTDVYNDHVAAMAVRSDEWGTLETAWGDGPFTMTAAKAVVFFYQVKTHAKSEWTSSLCQHNSLIPCLSSIGRELPLVGGPVAERVSVEAAVSLYQLFTETDPKAEFTNEYEEAHSSTDAEQQFAHRLVCSTLECIRVRFNSLNKASDWNDLYDHLRSHLSLNMAEKGSVAHGKFLLKEFPPRPASEPLVRKCCWMMMNIVTPIRISFLDGQRRATGAMYSLLQRKPESSVTNLYESLDPELNDNSLSTNKIPNFEILSSWMTIDSVRPHFKKNESNMLTKEELALLKRHSELIQQESTSSRGQRFKDALVRTLSKLETNNDLRNKLVRIGEEQQRKGSNNPKKFHVPDHWEKNDEKKNQKVFIEMWDFVLGTLFDDTADSVKKLITYALKNMWAANPPPVSERKSIFLTTNRASLKSDLKTEGMSFGKLFKINGRPELNSIAMLFAHYISDVKTISKLVNLTAMETGTFASSLSMAPRAQKNSEGKIFGTTGEGGVFIQVSNHDCLSNFMLPCCKNAGRDTGIFRHWVCIVI
jgi:hypothetical protein